MELTMKASTARRVGSVCLMLGLAALTAPTFAADTWARAPIPDTLLKASQDDANWILPAKTYSGNRFTALKQIDKSNVTALSQSWRTVIADDGEQEAAPLGLHMPMTR
jgi:alcohol dehydrogenase (cytochrome c)